MFLLKQGRYFFLCILIIPLIACRSGAKLMDSKTGLASLVSSSAVFNNHFTGFALYDPGANTFIFQSASEKLYTPASNTKIITLYASLVNLPGLLPSYKFIENEDKILIKGIGDPSFLHPLWQQHAGLEKLINTSKQLFLVNDQYTDMPQGAGWAWDDYQEDYQADITDFPLYGNLCFFRFDSVANSFQVIPPSFQNHWYWNIKESKDRLVSRGISNNEFYINKDLRQDYYIPFRADPKTIVSLLSDTLKKQIFSISEAELINSSWQVQAGIQADSVYAQMMKISDNFIAEQLICMVGSMKYDTCHTGLTLKKLKKELFDSLPAFQWYDGSGLSRYNLISPNHLVYILKEIYKLKGKEWIKKIFPAGGVSGTIRNNYKAETPYVFAKTGSLMNNHSLSGYVQTAKGRWLIFSFMHSNYTGSAAPIRNEMQKVLEFVRDMY